MLYIINRADLPHGCVDDCSHQGDCIEDVRHWLRAYEVAAILDAIPVDQIRACLKGYGAWDEEQLADDEGNRERLLWIACCNMSEGDSDFCVE